MHVQKLKDCYSSDIKALVKFVLNRECFTAKHWVHCYLQSTGQKYY